MIFWHIIKRELQIAMRKQAEILNPLWFFLIATLKPRLLLVVSLLSLCVSRMYSLHQLMYVLAQTLESSAILRTPQLIHL